MRVGIYYTPLQGSVLNRLAEEWLGYSAYDRCEIPSKLLTPIKTKAMTGIVDDPRHYGFHATLKAPMFLNVDKTLTQLEEELANFSKEQKPVLIKKLVLKQIGSFFALVPEVEENTLTELASNCVKNFEPFRADLTREQIKKRLKSPLTEQQKSYLFDWGYPYVFDQFKFHLTLTGHINRDQTKKVKGAIERHFAPIIDQPIAIDQLALFIEEDKQKPFYIHQTYCLNQ